MLTTISLAPSCLTETWLSSSVGATTQPGVVLGKPHDPNCWPGNRDLTTTISPAICPYGYTSACDIVDASRRDDTETVWACCPSHFWCDGGIFSCVKSLVEGSTNTYTAIDTDIFGNTITTQIMKTDGINAHSIRVAFHSSDILDHLSPTSGPSLSNPTPARTLTSPFPTASSEPAPTAPNPEVWPAGAWVGIGVGVTIGAIILLSSVVWLARRQYRKRQQQLSGQQDATEFSPESNMSQVPEIHSVMRAAELNSTPGLYELDGKANNTALINRLRGT